MRSFMNGNDIQKVGNNKLACTLSKQRDVLYSK